MTLLERLADGAWHSGTALATDLGISRAAVWKQVQAARELGAPVQAVRGRGYRLPGGYTPLDLAAIRAALSPLARDLLRTLDVFTSIDSTSSNLLRADNAGFAACFAEHQTGGRGRRGRDWSSPFGANLYFSLSCAFDPAPPAIGALSPAVGVSLARALADLGADAVRVKWPNDLVTQRGKLGGILLEHRGEAAGGCRVVIGVGLNVEAAPEVTQPTVRLADLVEALPERNRLAATVLEAVLRAAVEFRDRGFEPFRRQWPALDALHDRDVWLEEADGRRSAHVLGVAEDGALVAEVDGETRRFYAGELSVRGQE